MFKRIGLLAALLLIVVTTWLLTTNSARVWPYRSAARYGLLHALGAIHPPAPDDPRGTLGGVVRSATGAPIAGATVLLSARDGTTFSADSDAAGRYIIRDVPAGSYIPVAGAPGYRDTAIRTLLGTTVRPSTATALDITLAPRGNVAVSPPTDVRLSEPLRLYLSGPIPATAIRREVHFRADRRANQTTLFYTPDDGQSTTLPTLLAVYPGPADTWESVSMPLAQAGFAVIAIGPDYALDLEQDIDDLQRLVALINGGTFPRADRERIGSLAGSYSGLHVLRLIIRDPGAIDAALLLGPPTDLFELRRQFEAGSFFPPFGLDQALIALGLPGDQPERYWRYSARFHARDLTVPLMLIHSKEDEVVPFTQSEILAAELERLGKPHELHILDGMGHYLLATERTPAIDDLFNTTTAFFNEHLAPNPAR